MERNLIRKTKVIKEKIKKRKGITLIALIITIIVLLILAGVSISMLAGENGILNRAVDASKSTGKAQAIEEAKIEVLEKQTINTGKISKEEFEKILEKYFKYNAEEQDLPENLEELVLETKDGKYKGIKATEVYNGGFGTTNNELKVGDVRGKELIEKNTELKSDDNVKVTLPAGFTIPKESPSKAIEGIIITDSIDENGNSNGNEFVWIPINSDLTVVGTEKPMAKVSEAEGFKGKTGELTNYEGVFYYFNGKGEDTESVEGPNGETTYGQVTSGTTNQWREPDTAPGTSYYGDGIQKYLEIIRGILEDEEDEYADIGTFKETMQKDYNKMIQSVKDNGGFYVSRYEMGIADGKAISKSVIPTNAKNAETSSWYGLYARAKTYKNINKTAESSVESSMMWGSQYDAILNYALTGKDKEKVTAYGNGCHSGSSAIETGKTETDKIINIYDLEGNLKEWTLEVYSYYTRALRGGDYKYSIAPSSVRSNANLDFELDELGTRFTLYVN